jgi:FkbM family methyltransferase
MANTWNLRHSPIGWIARKAIHASFRLRHPQGKPVRYKLARSIDISLYPDGEIAEFLSFPALFERAEIDLVAAFLKPGMNVIDVGANIGIYSILGSAIVGDTGHVWAFEPSQESYGRLLRNLQLNGCKQVDPIQAALSSEPDKQMRLTSDAGYGDAYRYLAPASEGTSDARGEVVPVTTLDRCARERGIGDVNLIKIDVEGGEYRVLLGAKEVLASNREVAIIFESEADWCGRAGCKQSDSFSLLRNHGFHLYSWNKATCGWEDDEEKLLSSGMVWATRNPGQLPKT